MPATRSTQLIAELMASKYLTCYNTVFAEDFAQRFLFAFSASGKSADEFLGSLPHHVFPGE